MGTSPLPNPGASPPLGGKACPDPRYAAGRALTLHGCATFLGAHWVIMGVADPSMPWPGPVPAPPPTVFLPAGPEGAIPFLDDTETP